MVSLKIYEFTSRKCVLSFSKESVLGSVYHKCMFVSSLFKYAVAFVMGMSHEIVVVYQCVLGGEEEEHEEEGGPTDHEGPDHHRHHCRYPI